MNALPAGAIKHRVVSADLTAAAALAVVAGAASVQEVADMAGCSKSTAWFALHEVRDQGLCDWEDGKAGTLRATARVVARF